MDNLLVNGKKKSFSFFDAALACVVFIILNIIFLQAYSAIPASTIHGNIVVPETTVQNGVTYSVTSLSDEAFYACSKIENIVLPNSITKIGKNAFAGCGMKSIFLPSSVNTISGLYYDESPFYACSPKLVIYLESESIPETFDEFWNYRNSGEPLTVKCGYTWKEYLKENNLNESDLVSTDNSQVSFIYSASNTSASAIKGKEGFCRSNKVVYMTASFLIEAVFGVAAVIVAFTRKVNLVEASGMNKKINGKIVLWGFLIAVVCLITFTGLTNLFISILYMLGYKSSSSGIDIPNFGMYIIYLIISCVSPAFFEELLFRGTILSGFKKYGVRIAVILSAVIFMLMHGSPDQTVHQFIIGIVIGYIFIKTGNLWLGSIIHFFNNAIAITEVYLFQIFASNIEESLETVETVTVTAGSIIFDLIYTILMAYLGFKAVKYLMAKLIEENNKINNVVSSGDVSAQAVETTININGEPTTTQMTISVNGATESFINIDEEAKKDFENDELFAEIQEKHKETKETGKQQSSLAPMILLTMSIGYLVIEWLLALLNGLG